MNDMSAVIIPKSDQINADDLLSGPRTVTIRGVTIRPGTEQPVSIEIEDDRKVFRPCKSMARVMVHLWGPDANAYTGRSMTLYCDPKVLWGGVAVGGIRISHASHIERDQVIPLTEKKGSRKPFLVKVLQQPKPAPAEQPQTAAKPKIGFDVWLDGLRVELDEATNLDEVQEIAGRDGLQKMLGNPRVTEEQRMAINDVIKAALYRYLPPEGDADPFGEAA